jgi:glycosyltransferase involved in cell wall biosynthesis
MKEFEATDFEALAVKRKARAAARYSSFLKNIMAVVNEVCVPTDWPTLPPILQRDECPPISIVTLMYNRRKFFDLACHNILASDYPKSQIEWIIVEDSDDPNEDASDLITAVANKSDALKIVYVPLKKKTSVATKRNIGVRKATAEIVLMMDDDDRNSSNRISNSSAVTIDAGTLATATFNETISSLLLTNGYFRYFLINLWISLFANSGWTMSPCPRQRLFSVPKRKP